MTFDDLTADLRAALAGGLPGTSAHLPLGPRPRPGWTPGVVPEGLRQAAALLLLYPRPDGSERGTEWYFPLTVRGDALRRHSGQVSLPGGVVDPHETIEQAAVREAEEELGL